MTDSFVIQPGDEDIHTANERRLKVGLIIICYPIVLIIYTLFYALPYLCRLVLPIGVVMIMVMKVTSIQQAIHYFLSVVVSCLVTEND